MCRKCLSADVQTIEDCDGIVTRLYGADQLVERVLRLSDCILGRSQELGTIQWEQMRQRVVRVAMMSNRVYRLAVRQVKAVHTFGQDE